jgi:acetoacetyl-CoA synthetase
LTSPLWTPSKERVSASNMARFISSVNNRYKKSFSSYHELYNWSIENISDFWQSLLDFTEIKFSTPFKNVIDDPRKMPGARWFEAAKLNFAENLLRYRDDRRAIVFKGEGRDTRAISYRELYESVSRLASALRGSGVTKGDRVAGFLPNIPEAIIAMLGATSIGAIWSSCSPDFGIEGVLDRFAQIKPKVLIGADGYSFRGKEINCLEKLSIISDHLKVDKLVVVPYLKSPDITGLAGSVLWNDYLGPSEEIKFEQMEFMDPLYIMYSSGTTGLPKCLVQSVGGVLLQHVKELVLHTDLKRDDRIFYFTTTGWMMWNWLVSSLYTGATVVLYDGSPFYPSPGALLELAEREEITVFGTSARYIAALEKESISPIKEFDLSPLRTVLSTGSPLSVESFNYVYREIKKDVQLASISGGTDINGCFALGNPMLPVYPGELQCRGLGMAVEAFDEDGRPVRGRPGELVCTAPFPSMPIYFWNDSGDEKYQKSYFAKYKNVWAHGDFIEITERDGVVIYGRSDATLNPGGVRIGTSDIYRQVEKISEIEDSLVVGQKWAGDERIVLFVKLRAGVELDEALLAKIRDQIRSNTSPRHLPAKIIAVPDIPYTINLKKVELAVKNVIHGQPVTNRDALMNPQALDYFRDLTDLRS